MLCNFIYCLNVQKYCIFHNIHSYVCTYVLTYITLWFIECFSDDNTLIIGIVIIAIVVIICFCIIMDILFCYCCVSKEWNHLDKGMYVHMHVCTYVCAVESNRLLIATQLLCAYAHVQEMLVCMYTYVYTYVHIYIVILCTYM